MSGDHVCRVIYDADGNAIGRAQVSPDITDDELAAVAQVLLYAQQLQAERDAADPVGAAERAGRQEAAIARVRERARLRGAE